MLWQKPRQAAEDVAASKANSDVLKGYAHLKSRPCG